MQVDNHFENDCQINSIVILNGYYIIDRIMLTLTLLEQTFTLHRLEPDAEIPFPALRSSFFAIVHTDDETSLVLPESIEIESDKSDVGWACFKVEGPLEFSLVGILAGIASLLAEAKIPIFALSTFDTDYILVKREQVQAAKEALRAAGYSVKES
jgi:hypothetical protein